MPAIIPESHRDLFTRPVYGILTTLLPDGAPQMSLIWVDSDGADVLINTTLERRKGRDLAADPRATVLVVDPANSARWIEVRGHVTALTRAGAVAHADRLALRYDGKAHFYGDIYPAAQEARETRVIARLTPDHVACDAIFP